jgi:hypothetical protein
MLNACGRSAYVQIITRNCSDTMIVIYRKLNVIVLSTKTCITTQEL